MHQQSVSDAMNYEAKTRSGVSGNHAHEALVQFPLIVEDRLAHLIHGPHALRVVGVINEPAREYLIAVPRRIKEIDRLTTGDAVSGRADIEWNVIARDDISRLPDLVPGVQRKRNVMKLVWLGSPDERNVVSLV
jgi:hypothetical protein